MKKKNTLPATFGLAIIVALMGVGFTQADAVLSFDENTGRNGINNDQSVGWQFDVLSPLTVTGLGWFDEGGDGLDVGHTVGIWDPTGVLLESVFVPAGTGASLDGQFRTVAVTPFTLSVGTGYIVGGQNFLANVERLATDVDQTVDPRIKYIDATFADIGGFERPTFFSVSFNGFYGPSFSVNPVPEPSSTALLGVCLIGAWMRRRR